MKMMMTRSIHLGVLSAAVSGVLVAVGMLLLMMVVLAEPAEATFPGQNGNIAYYTALLTDISYTRDVYTIPADGGVRFNVTKGTPPDAKDPNYSPNGRNIAYAGYDGHGDFEIYTISSGGGSAVPLTDNETSDFAPCYSPDGKKIAYQGYDGHDYEIYTINNPGGGGRVPLTNNTTDDLSPDYSPDGKKIAYSSEGEIYTIPASGGVRTHIPTNTTHDSAPSYSPDGTKIAYSGYGGPKPSDDFEIFTINDPGGSLRSVGALRAVQLTQNSTTDAGPSYSPDGTKIAFSGHVAYGDDSEILTIPTDGGVRFNVTNNTRDDFDPSWGSSPTGVAGKSQPSNRLPSPSGVAPPPPA